MRFTNLVTINRPVADVFAYLARLENIPAWNYAIASTAKLTDGPVRVGTRYLQRRTLPKPSEEVLEVVELDPDRRLVLRGDLGLFGAEVTYELQPAASGPGAEATTLANTMVLRASGGLRLIGPVAARPIRASVAANLEVLKRILDG
jgi:uncharacterized protein YndB with AHSA1/START domain